MIISSPVFTDGEEIPRKYTCSSDNISPPLEFRDIPRGSKTLLLIVEDTDAQPEPWIHWLVFNIPVTTKNIREGSVPEGSTEGLANNQTYGYEGPCRKYFSGIHHYYFRLYALNSILEIPKASDKNAVVLSAEHAVLETAELMGIAWGNKRIA